MIQILVSSEANLAGDECDCSDAGFEGEPAISSAASPGCSFDSDVTRGCGNNGGFAFHCCLLGLENKTILSRQSQFGLWHNGADKSS